MNKPQMKISDKLNKGNIEGKPASEKNCSYKWLLKQDVR